MAASGTRTLAVLAVLATVLLCCSSALAAGQSAPHSSQRSLLAKSSNKTTAPATTSKPTKPSSSEPKSPPSIKKAAVPPQKEANVETPKKATATKSVKPEPANGPVKPAGSAGLRTPSRIGNSLLAEPDLDLRVDGRGNLGGKMQQLLNNINSLSDRVPRLGSEAVTQTATRGESEAQRRTSTTLLNTLPLLTAADAAAGAAANSSRVAVTVTDSGATSVAKDIVDDNGGGSKNFGAASSAQGVTVTEGSDGQAGGSSTLGRAATEAGERTGQAVIDSAILDGGLSLAQTNQRGIGEKVSTRLQAASLASTSPSSGSSGENSDTGGPTNSGGAIQFGAADTKDVPGLSTTADFKRSENTLAQLNALGRAVRNGYTLGRAGQDNVGDVRATGSRSARAALKGGQFGTGFHFGGGTATSRTLVKPNGVEIDYVDYEAEGRSASSPPAAGRRL